MAQLRTREQIAMAADIRADAPARPRNAPVDRTFELPTSLYATTVALFLGFIALMAAGFAHLELAIPLAIIGFFIVIGFGIPALWTQLAPENPVSARSWARFRHEGIMTASGRTTARDATVQVLILPVLIFIWGVLTVIIAALV
jgi:hypothetical protein